MLFRDENHHLDEVLDHWKEDFEEKEQEREGRIRNVGIELKFPVVDKEGRAVSPGVMTDLWEFLGEEGWEVITDGYLWFPRKKTLTCTIPFAGTMPGFPATIPWRTGSTASSHPTQERLYLAEPHAQRPGRLLECPAGLHHGADEVFRSRQ